MVSSCLGFICECADPEPCALRHIPLPTPASSTFQVKWAVFRGEGRCNEFTEIRDVLFTGMLCSSKEHNSHTFVLIMLLSPCTVTSASTKHMIPFPWNSKKRQNYSERKKNSCFSEGAQKAKGHQGTFGIMKTFCILIVIMVTQLYTFVKTQTVH